MGGGGGGGDGDKQGSLRSYASGSQESQKALGAPGEILSA